MNTGGSSQTFSSMAVSVSDLLSSLYSSTCTGHVNCVIEYLFGFIVLLLISLQGDPYQISRINLHWAKQSRKDMLQSLTVFKHYGWVFSLFWAMQSHLEVVCEQLHYIFLTSDLHDYLHGVVCFMYDIIPSFLTWHRGDCRASEIMSPIGCKARISNIKQCWWCTPKTRSRVTNCSFETYLDDNDG